MNSAVLTKHALHVGALVRLTLFAFKLDWKTSFLRGLTRLKSEAVSLTHPMLEDSCEPPERRSLKFLSVDDTIEPPARLPHRTRSKFPNYTRTRFPMRPSNPSIPCRSHQRQYTYMHTLLQLQRPRSDKTYTFGFEFNFHPLQEPTVTRARALGYVVLPDHVVTLQLIGKLLHPPGLWLGA